MNLNFFSIGLVLLAGQGALADILSTCVTYNSRAAKVVEFTVKETPSKRLSSPVIFTNNGAVVVIPQNEVAQFQFVKDAAYFLVDNLSEIPVLRLSVKWSTNKYVGTVSTFSSTGAVVSNIKVRCLLSKI